MNNEEANFRESVIKCCWDVMNEIGNEQLSVDILVDKISPKAKEMIPIEVKNEMIDLIQNALMSEFNIN
ncbi:Enhancer of yellow 2 transcription factor-like protein [Sarcoptes scabiei]|uniref:Enhancer of yellow 2 transcription factor-like protein n=1 Tax=Sarcoptes scabiei TaxID=52283 RepID=A0A132AD71_SARSC|nr:Enhancer of yellow 2 transcription factor-like protein [Sarcoptes scabiei]